PAARRSPRGPPHLPRRADIRARQQSHRRADRPSHLRHLARAGPAGRPRTRMGDAKVVGHVHGRLIAFDLDGTLVDSRRDLTDSANQLIEELGGTQLAEERIGRMIGEGAAILVRRALEAAGLHDRPGALARLRAIYRTPLRGIPTAYQRS